MELFAACVVILYLSIIPSFQGAGTEISEGGAHAAPGSDGTPTFCNPPGLKLCTDFSTTKEPAGTLLRLTAKL